ncbi:MAG: c-type cytochrome domain-containing protein [Planctomycetota bacterium]
MRTHSLLFLLTMPLALAGTSHAQSKNVHFEKSIWPILEKNCIECHRATYVDKNGRKRRPKGRVMLDTMANIQKSKRGRVIIAKDADNSLLMESIALPADDEDRMPPPKKGPPLSKQQVELIRTWIDEGADYGKWTGDDSVAADPKTSAGGRSSKSSSKPTPSKAKPTTRRGPAANVVLAKGLNPIAPEKLKAFAQGPLRVTSIGDDSPLLYVTCCGNSDEVGDDEVAALAPLAEHIFELDLARSRCGDAACATIAKMPRLTKLDLRGSKVSDAGVKQLAACAELRSVNLFGTDVGDYSMLALERLKKLTRLYVWQTEVSAKAVVRLRERLPALKVVHSADLPPPPAPTNERSSRRR